jgi:hypothetical protein
MNDKMNMCISVNTVLIEKNTQSEVYNMYTSVQHVLIQQALWQKYFSDFYKT